MSGGSSGASRAVEMGYEDDGSACLIVVSFDPGVTTGWAIHRTPIDTLTSQGFSEAVWDARFGWCSGQIGGLDEDDTTDAMIELTRYAYTLGDYSSRVGDRFAIAMEDFVLQILQMDRSLLSPVRVFSKYEYAMKKLCEASGVVLPYHKASASDAKRIVTDERLSRWNLLKPGMQHARDAQRHGILLTRKYSSAPSIRRSIERSGLK